MKCKEDYVVAACYAAIFGVAGMSLFLGISQSRTRTFPPARWVTGSDYDIGPMTTHESSRWPRNVYLPSNYTGTVMIGTNVIWPMQ